MLIFRLFLLGFLLESLSLFLLKQGVKKEQKPDALAKKTSLRRENLSFPCKQTACNLFQNICFNGSHETQVERRESRLTRNKMRGGNLLLSGTVGR